LESRLSGSGWPESGREEEIVACEEDGGESEGEDDGADDLHRYREVLYAIGELGRFGLEQCLPTLARYVVKIHVSLAIGCSRFKIPENSKFFSRNLMK